MADGISVIFPVHSSPFALKLFLPFVHFRHASSRAIDVSHLTSPSLLLKSGCRSPLFSFLLLSFQWPAQLLLALIPIPRRELNTLIRTDWKFNFSSSSTQPFGTSCAWKLDLSDPFVDYFHQFFSSSLSYPIRNRIDFSFITFLKKTTGLSDNARRGEWKNNKMNPINPSTHHRSDVCNCNYSLLFFLLLSLTSQSLTWRRNSRGISIMGVVYIKQPPGSLALDLFCVSVFFSPLSSRGFSKEEKRLEFDARLLLEWISLERRCTPRALTF